MTLKMREDCPSLLWQFALVGKSGPLRYAEAFQVLLSPLPHSISHSFRTAPRGQSRVSPPPASGPGDALQRAVSSHAKSDTSTTQSRSRKVRSSLHRFHLPVRRLDPSVVSATLRAPAESCSRRRTTKTSR